MHSTSIVFACDANYATAVAVAIASLVKNSSVGLDIHCIGKNLTSAQTSAMMRSLQATESNLTFHHLKHSPFEEWKTINHLKTATYYRILIPQLIKSERALYLDGDIVVTCDIAPLLDIDLDGNWIAGCFDSEGGNTTTIPQYLVEPYINAGIILMDLKQLRRNDFISSCNTMYSFFHENLKYADQCIINACTKNRKLIIAGRWNTMISTVNLKNPGISLEKLLDGMVGKSIFHATGAVKPWMFWADRWLSNIWLEYARIAFDDVESLIEYPTTLKEYQDIYLTFASQRQFQRASGVLDLLLTHYKKKASELVPAYAGVDESLVIELENLKRWREVVLEKARLVQVYRECCLVR